MDFNESGTPPTQTNSLLYKGAVLEFSHVGLRLPTELTFAKDYYLKHSEGFLKLVNDAKTRIREVTVADTRERLAANSDVRLIDVREDNEWDRGRAAGSTHLAKGIIERDIEVSAPDKSTEVILYCGGGYRSALAADVLQNMGYTNVFSMAGGWKAWKESGAPTEEG